MGAVEDARPVACLSIGDPHPIGGVNDEGEDLVSGRPSPGVLGVVGVGRPHLAVEGGHPAPVRADPDGPLAVHGDGGHVVVGEVGRPRVIALVRRPSVVQDAHPAMGGEPLTALVIYDDALHVVARQVVLGVEVLDIGAFGDAPANHAAVLRARPEQVPLQGQGLHVVAVGVGGPGAVGWRAGHSGGDQEGGVEGGPQREEGSEDESEAHQESQGVFQKGNEPDAPASPPTWLVETGQMGGGSLGILHGETSCLSG